MDPWTKSESMDSDPKMSLCQAMSESAFTIGHLLGSESSSPRVHICEMELSYITC